MLLRYRLIVPLLTGACTGLAAGPETSAVKPLSVSRDSAYMRAERALKAEVFTLEVQDPIGGRLAGLRYPSSSAETGTAAACRLQVSVAVHGGAETTELATMSRWVAPTAMAGTAGDLCERDRVQTLQRIEEVIVPAE